MRLCRVCRENEIAAMVHVDGPSGVSISEQCTARKIFYQVDCNMSHANFQLSYFDFEQPCEWNC